MPKPADRRCLSRIDLVAVSLLACTVAAIYGARLNYLPLVGEETRWATAAREMLDTGDWIVPRQQGHVFPERPPMTMWMMAIAGWMRGEVDAVAVRMPSVIAVVLTSLLVFGYTRAYSSTFAAATAGLAYATMGQVLQIGRHGESEALFALFLAASLLVWHVGYTRAWRPVVVWASGFALAALAALVKGPQAPVYFGAITSVYLLVRREWRYLVSWSYAIGATVFVAIIAAWQIPFYLATDWEAVAATWSGLAGDRFHLSGVLSHVLTYPLETFICLLPWSPILGALFKRETREILNGQRSVISFILTAVLVAYPSVWMAAGARGRYFMPLYPLVAVLVGLVIDRCATAPAVSYPQRAWRQFVLLWAIVIGCSSLLFGVASLLYDTLAVRFYQPQWFGLFYAIFAFFAAYLLWGAFRHADRFRPTIAVCAIAAVASIGVTGLLLNVHAARWRDPTADVAKIKQMLPPNANLASFSPIEHRFAYYYREPIAELNWPTKTNDVPADLEYFCFMRTPGDTAESRSAGRGRTCYTTPGTLPFEWQELGSICVERQKNVKTPQTVVLGRIVRPVQPAISDVSVPQATTARATSATKRK
jgi:4-amino-4-deoxy-L-arabinose transferase-like glycosyltransferase